jgi:hypothetical protein
MIVLLRFKSDGLDPQSTAHSEMNPEPVFARKLKEHLLPARKGTEELLPNEPASEKPHIGPAKDPFLRMTSHRNYPLTEPGIPLFPK